MKAALLEKIDAPLVIRELLPTMLMPGQVLVKVKASGICGAQLHEIRGHKGNEKFLPHPMGHEGCGIVKEVGPGVTTVKEGDKVVMHWRPGAGIESDFPKYVINNTDKLNIPSQQVEAIAFAWLANKCIKKEQNNFT